MSAYILEQQIQSNRKMGKDYKVHIIAKEAQNMGKKNTYMFVYIYIYIYDSLCCKPKANTIL